MMGGIEINCGYGFFSGNSCFMYNFFGFDLVCIGYFIRRI